MAANKIRHQRRIPGVRRVSTYAAMLPSERSRIDVLASRYGVSRSWVSRVLQADQLGLPLDPEDRFETPAKPMKRRRRSR